MRRVQTYPDWIANLL